MSGHEHEVSDGWPQVRVPGATGVDPTLLGRVQGAAHDKCKECAADLSMEAAANAETLAVLLGSAIGLLIMHDLVPGFAFLEGRLEPVPPLATVINRMSRKGDHLHTPTVIGMLRTFSAEDRLGLAAACMEMQRQFFIVLHQQRPCLSVEEQEAAEERRRRGEGE